MASLNSILTIKFDPDDRELLERVAAGLERGTVVTAPVVAEDESDDDNADDEDESPAFLSSTDATREIATYLGLTTSQPLASVVQGVKDLGSRCQDLEQNAVSCPFNAADLEWIRSLGRAAFAAGSSGDAVFSRLAEALTR